MSIASEINRISEQKNIIRDKMRDMGLVGQTESPSIDGLASKLKNNVRIDAGSTSREVLEGESITIQAGYYKANVTVSGKTNEAADKQKIKALESKIIPTKSEQDYPVPEGYYGYGSFTVAAIGDEYQDTSDAKDIGTHQVLANKIFYNSKGRQVGEMPNNGEWDAYLDLKTPTKTIPVGYHDGEGFAIIHPEDEHEITPDEESHTISPADGFVLSTVKVNPIPAKYKDTSDAEHILPEDVLTGCVYYDDEGRKVGEMPRRNPGTVILDTTYKFGVGGTSGYSNYIYGIPAGYHDGGGQVMIRIDDSQEVTPSKSAQFVYPAEGWVLGAVKVNRIPNEYQDLTRQTVSADDVLNTAQFVEKDGTLTTGKIANLQVIERYVDTYEETGWELGESGFVKDVSIVFDNTTLIAKLREI